MLGLSALYTQIYLDNKRPMLPTHGTGIIVQAESTLWLKKLWTVNLATEQEKQIMLQQRYCPSLEVDLKGKGRVFHETNNGVPSRGHPFLGVAKGK